MTILLLGLFLPCLPAAFGVPKDFALQGVQEKEVLFGQSAALSGAAKDLGINMRLGLLAAFNQINEKGGVAGRKLKLLTHDDSYEPEQTASNIRKLIDQDKVFAVLGGVGTPTSKAAVPILSQTPLLYIGPFTGASFLRTSHPDTVINVRASYAQETKEMVLRLKKDLKVSRIGVLYQNDSYGLDGLAGVRKAVKSLGGVRIVSLGTYVRNTTAVKTALLDIKQGRPQAVIIIGSYAPAASFIRWAEKMGMNDVIFLSVSFVGVSALAQELRGSKTHVFVTQVVPFPWGHQTPLLKNYKKAMKTLKKTSHVGLISLEGYVVGRLVIKALERVGEKLDYKSFAKAFKRSQNKFNLDGLELFFDDAKDNQGSDRVFLTRIDGPKKIVPVSSLKALRKRK